MNKEHNDGEHKIGDTVERIIDSYCSTKVGVRGTVMKIEGGMFCKQILYLKGDNCGTDGMKGDRFKTVKRGKKMKIERKYKAKDKVIAVASCDGDNSFVGKEGTIIQVKDSSHSTSYPYCVRFSNGNERWCEESSLKVLTPAQKARLKTYQLVTPGQSKYNVMARNNTELDEVSARYLKSNDRLDVYEVKKYCVMTKEIVVKRRPA